VTPFSLSLLLEKRPSSKLNSSSSSALNATSPLLLIKVSKPKKLNSSAVLAMVV
jgi:hypothetical protein